ncbi:MAG: 3-hydroxyacyl-CoA dehydrogenase [Acidimicrobiales bacterium]|nr:MAG: 3-hydroxyacyl-CoA dehydrogenase [Acidimicrobiales bacterium]
MSVEFPDELIAHALTRYVQPFGLEGEIALVTLDNQRDHTKPTSFGPAGLRGLGAALDAIATRTPSVRAIAITGKPYIFGAGADVTGMPTLRSQEQVREVGRLGHEVFSKLRDSAIPTFAFINGLALGGALELALHCHYRTLSGGARAIALPECSIGLVPGWGGSWLLPHLIGPEQAIRVIIEHPLSQNRMLTSQQAHRLGIGDALFEPADFLERSLEWAVSVLNGETVITRAPITGGPEWNLAVTVGRKIVDERLHGAVRAPLKALELLQLASTAGYAESAEAETQALAELLMGDECRASLYAFNLVQHRAKRPVGAPAASLARSVTKVGVVGAGLMATQLAVLFARRMLVPVVMTDINPEALAAGVARAHADIDRLVEKKRLNSIAASRIKRLISGSADRSDFADADLVIEAVFEELDIKRQVFTELEEIVTPECVLATNTSSLSVSAMAEQLRHPQRVVGLHFFNPVAVLPLVEVIRGEHTDDATLATAFAVAQQLKKSPVGVRDATAFVVNRVLLRCMNEVLAAIDSGTDVATADSALNPLGLPMCPLALLDLVGLPVALHVLQSLHGSFSERFPVSATLRRAVDLGKTSLLTWRNGVRHLDPDLVTAERVSEALTSDQLRDRVLVALAQEIGLMLDEQVVSEAADIDLCMLLGAGWPFYLGGITPYLDRTGISERVIGRRFLPAGVATAP